MPNDNAIFSNALCSDLELPIRPVSHLGAQPKASKRDNQSSAAPSLTPSHLGARQHFQGWAIHLAHGQAWGKPGWGVQP
eukprot:c46506_g1_i1 orf=56-292(+)